jgi:AcrR family transcriptional regulator
MARPRRDFSAQIVELAQVEFLRWGFQQVSLERLVRELDTSKSAFYRYFRSKHALVQAVLRRLNSQINRDLLIIVNGHETFSEKLSKVTAYTSDLLARVDDSFFHDLQTVTPDLWQEYLAARDHRVTHIYGRLFQSGRRDGDLRDDIPIPVVTRIYLQLTELVVNAEEIPLFRRHGLDPYETVQAVFMKGTQNPRKQRSNTGREE